jgi:hypothetical protein
MRRNIRVLHHFEPPTTKEEIEAAALQYVRKVSGMPRAGGADHELIERATKEVASITKRLLDALSRRGEPRTREGEREKGRLRWQQREARIAARASGR